MIGFDLSRQGMSFGMPPGSPSGEGLAVGEVSVPDASASVAVAEAQADVVTTTNAPGEPSKLQRIGDGVLNLLTPVADALGHRGSEMAQWQRTTPPAPDPPMRAKLW